MDQWVEFGQAKSIVITKEFYFVSSGALSGPKSCNPQIHSLECSL
jgi:hypothetical protein